ncbi:hypothetical protein TRFO_34521 [Tritrichomonas foetus]|uniref:Thioredoxin domain-containing protein n=1 Tax=Tritrichomonas foetus TaxID=1144522 RepID=A0A1J4JL27_9EUKA|nr:hypothetical protein TRFO_34521 [Tritrichomonas foetus]|eukprot:OHS99119.1 hypothetical protein TRFO_34521 [Tritrichomonas foetus]
MLSFFIFSCFSNKFFGNVPILDDDEFHSKVVNRKPSKIWMIMFVPSFKDDSSKSLISSFSLTSKLLKGVINFGIVDTKNAFSHSVPFGFSVQPFYRIYSDFGEEDYLGGKLPNQMIENILERIPDNIPHAKKSWINEKSAILFTNEAWTPKWWRAICLFFRKQKDINFGVGRTDKIMDFYKVTEIPTILLIKGAEITKINYIANVSIVSETIIQFFNITSRIKTNKDLPNEDFFYSHSEFFSRCKNSQNLCVSKVAEKPNEFLMQVFKKHSKSDLAFFVGLYDVPYDFMKEKNGTWIYNPKKDNFIYIQNDQNLDSVMEKAIDGSAAFRKRVYFERGKLK